MYQMFTLQASRRCKQDAAWKSWQSRFFIIIGYKQFIEMPNLFLHKWLVLDLICLLRHIIVFAVGKCNHKNVFGNACFNLIFEI